MRATPAVIQTAEAALRRDPELGPAFAGLIDRHGPCPVGRRRSRSHFEALVRAIVYQQLAGRAAAAIYGRFRALVPGPLTADAVLALPETAMRGAGLSGAKTASIRDLTAHVATGTVPLARISRLPDDEIVDRLVVVRGIGRWTAEMFLIFQLGRVDVWPAGDLGVRKGIADLAELAAVPTEREMPAVGARFSPHRSVAAWYCWRAAETVVPA